MFIGGAGVGDEFGYEIQVDDFNSDGKTDLVVSAPADRNEQGLIHIFLNDTIQSDTANQLLASDSDYNIVGEAKDGSRFGTSIISGDFDSDGKKDIAVGAPYYDNTDAIDGGRVYLFFQNEVPWTNEENICVKNCTANHSDIILEGTGLFGKSLLVSDFNNDEKEDIAISAPKYGLSASSNHGRVYIFNQDMYSWTNLQENCTLCDSQNADVKITCMAGEQFGSQLSALDFNQDGVMDLMTSAYNFKNNHGIAHVFYGNLDSEDENIATSGYISTLDNADKLLLGEYLSSFGFSIVTGDINNDNLIDIIIGAPQYRNFKGRSYVFYGKLSLDDLKKSADEKDEDEEEEDVEAKHQDELEEEEEEITDLDELTDPVEALIDDVDEDVDAELEINLDEIEEVLEDLKDEFLVDISVPENPTIACSGFVDGEFSTMNLTTCTWTDTAGPSDGVYKYCLDADNECVPDIENNDLTVEISDLTEHHTYLRVQTSDEGGESDVVSFHLAMNNAVTFVNEPSDGGIDLANPVEEGKYVHFAVTAEDLDGDTYKLLVCRTGNAPTYNDGELKCSGIDENQYCASDFMESGVEAKCSYQAVEEPLDTSLWYAFVCEKHDSDVYCSDYSQGSEIEGSPFFVSHPSRYEKVDITNLDDKDIEPGDRLKFTLTPENLTDVPNGSPVIMYICDEKTTGFDYKKGECIDGELVCNSEPTDLSKENVSCVESEELENIVSIPTSAGEGHLHIYVKHGEKGIVDGSHFLSYNVADVRPELISYANENGKIEIPAGGSMEVIFSAVMKDRNGWFDIKDAEGVFFDSDGVWNDCDSNRNDCYYDDSCSLTQLDETQVRADCEVEVFYNANASEYWKVHVNPINTVEKFVDLGDSENTRTIPSLIAINQDEISVPYTYALPGEISGPVETILTNLGNEAVDVLVNGTDLVGENYTIPRKQQKWSLDKEFDYYKEGYSLVETALSDKGPNQGCLNLTLPVHEGSSEEDEDVILYWKLLVPENQKADLYTGSVGFTPAPNTCFDEDTIADITTAEEGLEEFYELIE